MTKPQAIFFDLDETLLDSSGFPEAIARTCAEVAGQHSGRLTADDMLLANQRSMQSYWPEVAKDWTLGAVSGAQVVEEAWRRALSACGLHDEALVRFALDAHARHSVDAHRPYDDVGQVVASLVGRFRLALITNGAADTQREKLRSIRMDGVFEVTAISGELGIAKPDRRIFQFVLDALGIVGADAWHVGDSLASDVAGAKASGLTAIWLNRRALERQPSDPEPDVELESLADLPRLIDAY